MRGRGPRGQTPEARAPRLIAWGSVKWVVGAPTWLPGSGGFEGVPEDAGGNITILRLAGTWRPELLQVSLTSNSGDMISEVLAARNGSIIAAIAGGANADYSVLVFSPEP